MAAGSATFPSSMRYGAHDLSLRSSFLATEEANNPPLEGTGSSYSAGTMDDSFSEDPRVPVTLADHLERNFSCSKAMRWALLFALVDGGIAAGADEANTSRALRRERSDSTKGVFKSAANSYASLWRSETPAREKRRD